MYNLAGKPIAETDEKIKWELKRSRVHPLYNEEPTGGEVNTHYTGYRAGFKYRRAWYYWVVEGIMPLDVAVRLYVDPVGKSDIRVAGHCGCEHPVKWCKYLNLETGKSVLCMQEKIECEKYAAMEGTSLREIAQKILAENEFDENRDSGKYYAYTDLYHIDSEVGLRMFTDAVITEAIRGKLPLDGKTGW